MDEPIDVRVARLHAEAPLTDVHAHPSLKSYLFGLSPCTPAPAGRQMDPLASRSNLPMAAAGGVRVIWAAHYVPEVAFVKGLKRCIPVMVAAFLMLRWRLPAILRGLLKGSPLERLWEMMDSLEEGLSQCPEMGGVARSLADMDRLLESGRVAVIHTVEGAHVVRHHPVDLDRMMARGVVMLTLSHFCWNGYADQVDAVPDQFPTNLMKRLCRLCGTAETAPGLTLDGKRLLQDAMARRLLIDVTHCTPRARQVIYAEADGQCPLIASHVGLRSYKDHPYSMDEVDLQAIRRSGGAIGVIFSSYWLSDADVDRSGLTAFWETVRSIHETTGSWDHIMLGTDFDGLTNPPDDMSDYRALPAVTRRLWEAMTADLGLTESQADEACRKILGGNARRLLEYAWG